MKKTSGRYKFVLLNTQTGNIMPIFCDVETGQILPNSPMKKSYGTDLTILDQFILKNITDEKELYQLLQSLGYHVKNTIPRYIYQHNKTTKYLELIYQNEFLLSFAQLSYQCKTKYSNMNKGISSKELRRIISKEISQEKLWKQFFQSFLHKIHDPEFYLYMTENPMLGERALGYINDYLENEHGKTKGEQEAFRSAQYYLIDTFTAYKPIRGMIVCEEQYKNRKHLEKREPLLRDTPWYYQTMRPIRIEERYYLEKHKFFDCLSDAQKIKFVNQILLEETEFQKKKEWKM